MEAVSTRSQDRAKRVLIRKATCDDQSFVVDILCKSFRHDPHMSWLLDKCRNPSKFRIMMTYLFQKTMEIGDIYITEDKKAVALWKSGKKHKPTWGLLLRNLKLLHDIGILSIIRILINERFTYKQYPKDRKFYHLYLIGVLPECQGKGYASQLLNPVLHEMAETSVPVYLETANVHNVLIYRKKGFKTYNTWLRSGFELYYMKKAT
jgi:ribosomal protein S18 acetylase RimI-like enzyme